MVLSESEAERRLADLRQQRAAIDRAIGDLALYLELGRRLGGEGGTLASPSPELGARRDPPEPRVAGERISPRAPDVSAEDDSEAEEAGSAGEGAQARRYGRALIIAALSVLEEAGHPLHVSEILAALTERGFTIPGQQDPVAALNTRLWKRSGPGGPLRRLGDAVYALP